MLDRGYAPRPKVRAFLNAIDVVERIGRAKIETRAAEGR